ncbi:hypothetical protein DFH07DRAFT_772641 [Mycena maculata]|uniref:F-box domain-containing protein n=1 Tax=Mycena maculata TaxID=230809 RepID=A0AAD7NE36_9AGAR|nr:hypothetical protein DFH07DRAFT_772641 [Mycena maculata]
MYWATPTKILRTHCIPIELWLMIWELVCFARFEDAYCNFAGYNGARDDLSLSGPPIPHNPLDVIDPCLNEWGLAIRLHPSFWRRLGLDYSTTPAYIERHLRWCGNLPLDVSLFFEFDSLVTESEDHPDYTLAIHSENLKHRVAVATQSLHAAVSSSHLWNVVCIWADTFDFMEAILYVLLRVSAPNIASLLFSSPPCYSHRDRNTTFLFIPPISIFSGSLPGLRSLQLWGTALPWGRKSYYGSINTLDLGHLPMSIWPRASELACTLREAVALRHLILGGGGAYVNDENSIPPFIMPSLETLTIDYTRDTKTFLLVLAVGSYPALRELDLLNLDPDGWRILTRVQVLAQVKTVHLFGSLEDVHHIPWLLAHLSSVNTLDIRATDPWYFDVLTTVHTVHYVSVQ